MTSIDETAAAAHNAQQRSYFEAGGQVTLQPTGSPYLRRHADQMVRFAGIKPGDRVLEVGCGLGRYTFILAEMGVKMEGLDLSPKLVEELDAINAGRYDIPTHGHDLMDCPPEMYGRYDAVIGFFVLHHVHDLDSCMQMAAKLIRPGGQVAFLEPNPRNPLYYIQITLTRGMSWAKERGLLKMRGDILTPCMDQAGLSEVRYRRFGFLPPFATNLKYGTRAEAFLEAVPVWQKALPFLLFGGRSKPQEPID